MLAYIVNRINYMIIRFIELFIFYLRKLAKFLLVLFNIKQKSVLHYEIYIKFGLSFLSKYKKSVTTQLILSYLLKSPMSITHNQICDTFSVMTYLSFFKERRCSFKSHLAAES